MTLYHLFSQKRETKAILPAKAPYAFSPENGNRSRAREKEMSLTTCIRGDTTLTTREKGEIIVDIMVQEIFRQIDGLIALEVR